MVCGRQWLILIRQDELLQECKGLNRKLVDYMATPSIVEQLVSYVVNPAAEDAEDKIKVKYPFVASEVRHDINIHVY